MADEPLPIDAGPERFTLGDRIKGARFLAGFSSQQALAEAINQRGLGASTIKGFERNAETPEAWQLDAIADACGVGRSFWEAEPSSFGSADSVRSRELEMVAIELDRLAESQDALLEAHDELRDDLLRSGVIKPRTGEEAASVLAKAATEETLAAALQAVRRQQRKPAQPGGGPRAPRD